MATVKEFALYSSEGCHLCEEALALYLALKPESTLNVIDIVEHEHLVEEYGIKIPVLKRLSDQTTLCWPFTGQQIKELI